MMKWPMFSGEIGRRQHSKWGQGLSTYVQIFCLFFNYLFYMFRSVPDNKTCSNESCRADKTINEQGMNNVSYSGKLLGRQA